ncbi:TonB-dependent receptor [Chitinophaga vietnamensis]|uniref:TonB-dependent receptor n=1 Tax=Chitinophaga vietnamensis TaxID=2593957 RepID=UPI0011789C8B|nr:TonB-dependent receptor [Chitinophaga vietnamensis]
MSLLCRPIFLFLLLLSICGAGSEGYSQVKKDSIGIGKVFGIVRDSTHDYVLPLASVAVYNAEDSNLISYQLSNNFGEFNFKGMPIGTLLRIIVSYTGYKSIVTKFTIPRGSKVVDLKKLNLERNAHELQEVIVKYVPPVRMNGDTLEFNADAFNLNKNAVGEDLLRRLPGVTIWGDGTITVNGREVSQVLVEGKPFLSGDTRVATQNIPKTAIDKIQVYQQIRNPQSPLDSITQINIKLKKGKTLGYFGKISAGYGTADRYESDASINFFNKKTQLGIVGASNNINKIANDVSTLMRNSTYKGIGANIEYQPDFRMQGTNRPSSGGVIFQHDFIANPDYYDNNRLSGNYFIKNNVNAIANTSHVITTIDKANSQTQMNTGLIESSNTSQVLNTRYDKRKDNFTFYTSATLLASSGHNKSDNQSRTYGTMGALESTNNMDNEITSDGKDMLVQMGLNKQKNVRKMNRLPGNLDVVYTLDVGTNNSHQSNITSFTSVIDPLNNRKFDRLYKKSSDDVKQHLSLSLGDISGLLFGNRGFMGISMTLQNALKVDIHKENNLVKNRDTITGNYKIDAYLSNRNKLTIVNEMPTLAISRVFTRGLVNRYEKILFLGLDARAQFYHQQNSSIQPFQNFIRRYQRFIPSASISYTNSHYGNYEDNYRLNFSTENKYPTVEQLYPLVDSINQYYIQQGNSRLKEATERKISFSMQHSSQQRENTFKYDLNIAVGIINDNLSDSSIIDNLGRSVHYTINAGDSRYLSISGTVSKAFKFEKNQLQVQFLPMLSLNRNPQYINGQLNFSNSFSNSNSLNIYYTLSDWWAINLQELLLLYRSKQTGASNSEFKNSTQSTVLSTSVNFTKRLGIGSNISYNYTTSSGSKAATFTIWNANGTFRLLPGNILELKIAALDLLHQNTNIINTGLNNTLTRGTTNVLQQYFMFTVSYFPRQFGRREKLKE